MAGNPNVVNIVIQATDAASNSLRVVSAGVVELGANAVATANSLRSIGTALVTGIATSTSTSAISGLTKSIKLLREVSEQPIAVQLFQQIGQAAEQAFEDAQPLRKILSSFSEGSQGLRGGLFAGLSADQRRLKETEDRIASLKARLSSIREAVDNNPIAQGDINAIKRLESQIAAQQKIRAQQFKASKDLDNPDVVRAKFNAIADKIEKSLFDAATNGLAGGLNALPLDKIPLLKNIPIRFNPKGAEKGVSSIFQQIDQRLSDVVIDETIKKKIPDSLKNAFQGSLANELSQNLQSVIRGAVTSSTLGNAFSSVLLSKLARQTVASGLSSAIRTVVTGALSDGFSEGLANAKGTVSKEFGQLGNDTAQGIVKGIAGIPDSLLEAVSGKPGEKKPRVQSRELFEKVDSNLLGGEVSKFFGKAFEGVPTQLIKSLLGGTDPGAFLGRLTAGLTKFLVADTGLRVASSAAIPGIGGAFAPDIAGIFLPKLTKGIADVIGVVPDKIIQATGKFTKSPAPGGQTTGFAAGLQTGSLEGLFEKQFGPGINRFIDRFVGNNFKSFGGRLIQQLVSGAQARLPAGIQQVISVAQANLSNEVKSRLVTAALQSIGGVVQAALKPLTESPVQKLEAEISKFQRIANNQDTKDALREALTRKKVLEDQEKESQKLLENRSAQIERLNKIAENPQSGLVEAAKAQKRAKELSDEIKKSNRDIERQKTEIANLEAKARVVSVDEAGRSAAAQRVEQLKAQIEEFKKIAAETGDESALKSPLEKAATAFNEKLKKGLGVIQEITSALGIGNAIESQVNGAAGNVENKGTLGKAIAKSLIKVDQSIFAPVFNELLKTANSSLLDLAGAFESSFKTGAVRSSIVLANLAGQFDKFLEGLPLEGLKQVGQTAATSFGKGFESRLLVELGPIADKVDSFLMTTVKRIESIPQKLSAPLKIGEGVAGYFSGLDEPLSVFSAITTATGQVTKGIFAITEQFAFFQQGIQAIRQLVLGGPFELLIGQNVKLREQLIATQSTLAATNQIVKDGNTIKDPTQAIQALAGPINSAIAKVRKGSLELVNVTSKDLIESFRIIAGEAGNIGFSLDQASKLTLSFGATLGTLGVPLFQARQEVLSILQGTIDQNSVVAKSLGLTNAQVERYKQQGTLVQNLLNKLEAFRAGNKLAAQTLGGVTSNLQELVDEIGRLAGEQLLEPLVQQATRLYDYLNDNKDSLADGLKDVVAQALRAAESVVDVITRIVASTQGLLAKIPVYLFSSLANALQGFATAIKTTLEILQPAINVLAGIAQTIGGLSSPFLTAFLTFKALQIGIGGLAGGFEILSRILPVTDQLMFFVAQRSNGLLGTFASLSRSVGSGAAGFLLLGKNMASIPGLAGLIAKNLGPFGGIIAGFIPTLSTFGIQLAGLVKMTGGAQGALGGFLSTLAGRAPGLISQLGAIAGKSELFASFAPVLQKASVQLGNYAKTTDLAGLINRKFAEATELAGKAIRQQILSFGLLAIGAYAAFWVIDNFILKNAGMMKLLKSLGETLSKIGQAVKDFFSSPFGIAIAVVTGLIVAIRLRLIPSIIDLAKEFIQLARTSIPNPLKAMTEAVESLGNAFRKNKSAAGTFIAEISGSALEGTTEGNKIGSKRMAEIQKEVEAEIADYEKQITERNDRIAKIDQESSALALQKSDKSSKTAGKQSALNAEKAALLKEVDGLKVVKEARDKVLSQLREAASGGVALADKVIDQGGFLGQTQGALKKRASELRKQLAASTEEYGQALAERNRRISQLDDEISLADPAKARATGRKPVGDFEGLKAERVRLTQEVSLLQEIRQTQEDLITAIEDKAANAPKASERIRQGVGDGFAKAKGSLVQFTGVAQKLSGEVLGQLGQAVATVGIDTLGGKVKAAGEQLAKAGIETLKTESAMKGFTSASTASSINLQGLGNVLKTAGSGITGYVQSVVSGALSMAAAAGPTLLLVGAITLAIEAYGTFTKINDAATESSKRFTEATIEAAKKFDELEKKRAAAEKKPPETKNKTTQELQDDRKKQIKEKQGFLEKTLDNADEFFGAGSSLANAQLKNETRGYEETLNQAQNRFNQLSTTGLQKSVDLEQKLAVIQKDRAEAAAKGDQKKVDSLDSQIKLTQEAIQANKDQVQAAIDGLTKENPLTAEQAKEQERVLRNLTSLQLQFDKLGSSIKPLELPRLGGFEEQFSNDVKTGLDALDKGGNPEQVAQKVKTTIDATQQLLKTGALSEDQAKGIFTTIANSDRVSKEIQQQALEGLTNSFQQQAQKRVEAKQAEEAEIQAAQKSGKISAEEADKQLTKLKIEQGEIQLEAFRNQLAEENRLRANQLQSTQNDATQDIVKAKERIKAAQEKLKKNPNDQIAKDEVKAAEKDIEAAQKRQETAQQNYDQAVAESNRKLANKEKQTTKERIEAETEERFRQIDRVAQKSIDVAKKAATERTIAAQKLFNSGEITQEEFAQVQAQVSQQQIQAELAAEQKKYEDLKKLRNADDAELRAQKLKVLDLTRQVVEGEAKLFDVYIGVLRSKLEDAARKYSNQLETQNQNLQRQATLIDAVTKALEQRNNLLKAGQDLIRGTSDFLTSELDALAKVENSETRKKELARASAVIKLSALRQEQAIAQQVFEIEQKRNRLALERKDIENQIAIAKAKADIAKGAAELKVAEQQRKSGRITQAEYEAKVLEQNAKVIGLQGLQTERGLIVQERALQPQLEAAARQQFTLKQRSEETGAYAQLIDTLRPGQKAAGRNFLRQRIANEYGIADAGDFRGTLNGEVQDFINQEFFGQKGNANPFNRFGAQSQKLLKGLNPSQVQLPNGLPTALPADLTATLGEIDRTAKGVKPGFNLPQAKGVKLTPAALEARSVTLSPDLLKDNLIQTVKATQAMTEVLKGFEVLKANPNNIIQIPSLSINVYPKGGDRQTAQATGEAVRQQLDTIFKKAEATARNK